MKIRIKFQKSGPLRFIGHLDVMRFFQKAIRRAGLDIVYTGGFSPHQIMTFAAPLGVGLESEGEYMDIELASAPGSRELTERLNAASVPGIRILSARLLPREAGNAMASVAAAGYTVCFRPGREPEAAWREGVEKFLDREAIPVQKETKKGISTVDLRPGIFRFSCQGNGVYMLLDASSAGNIKPQTVMAAYLESLGGSLQENALSITRLEIYTWAGEAGERHLVPLEEIGQEIPPEGIPGENTEEGPGAEAEAGDSLGTSAAGEAGNPPVTAGEKPGDTLESSLKSSLESSLENNSPENSAEDSLEAPAGDRPGDRP